MLLMLSVDFMYWTPIVGFFSINLKTLPDPAVFTLQSTMAILCSTDDVRNQQDATVFVY